MTQARASSGAAVIPTCWSARANVAGAQDSSRGSNVTQAINDAERPMKK